VSTVVPASDRRPATTPHAPSARAASAAPVTDIHQHLWPDQLLDALARRTEAPRLRRDGSVWRLEARGEASYVVDPADHDPARRASHAAADGIARVIVAPSCPIGIEALPAAEAAPLIDAYHAGAGSLGAPFRAWAAAGLADPDPSALASRLADGFVGLCLPAGALGVPEDVRRIAPLLDVLAARSAPLLVHPGPAPWSPVADLPRHAPAWWTPMTAYVAQMQRAWFVTNRWLREDFPGLRVCFAMLAGLAPLHDDRLRSRGADGFVPDGWTFLESSSYGQAVIDAVAGVVGDGAIVFGSDRPVVETAPTTAASARRARANAARLIDGEEHR
jgi:hypothetical protein